MSDYEIKESRVKEITQQISPQDLSQTPKLIGESNTMLHLRKLIELVAPSDATVLILGESGTGKELIARQIHQYSRRVQYPFIPVNCGAIPPDLLESELFGHEKGAFTGALTTRKGRFEAAHLGSLFLDEIGDMPLAMQVKLLRVLEEHAIQRIGSNKCIPVNVRIIAATHRNLEEAIIVGTFREDLFYRLNVFPIEIAPLRDRVEDIPLLIDELIQRFTKDHPKQFCLTPRAIDSLMDYPWPGNVRELANLIERLIILYSNHEVDFSDLPEKFRSGVTSTSN